MEGDGEREGEEERVKVKTYGEYQECLRSTDNLYVDRCDGFVDQNCSQSWRREDWFTVV